MSQRLYHRNVQESPLLSLKFKPIESNRSFLTPQKVILDLIEESMQSKSMSEMFETIDLDSEQSLQLDSISSSMSDLLRIRRDRRRVRSEVINKRDLNKSDVISIPNIVKNEFDRIKKKIANASNNNRWKQIKILVKKLSSNLFSSNFNKHKIQKSMLRFQN